MLQDGALTGLRQARWVPIESSVLSVLKIGLLLILVSISPRGGIFLAWTVPVLMVLVPINFLIFRRLIPRHLEQGNDVKWDLRAALRLAAGNYIGTLLLLAATMLLPIVVAAEAGSRQTAYFYIPWTIWIGLQLVAMNMATSLTVEVAYDMSKLQEYVRRATVHTMRLVLPVVAVLVIGAPYVLRAFGPSYARDGALLLRLLAVAAIPNVVIALGLGVARIHHNGRLALLIPAATAVLMLVLSVILLPPLGIDGVGWATLAAQVAVAIWLLGGVLRPAFLSERRP
jgi:O-antigen/teichoic acid export membrane protein